MAIALGATRNGQSIPSSFGWNRVGRHVEPAWKWLKQSDLLQVPASLVKDVQQAVSHFWVSPLLS